MRSADTYRRARRNRTLRHDRGVWHHNGVRLDPVFYKPTGFYSGDLDEQTEDMRTKGRRYVRSIGKLVNKLRPSARIKGIPDAAIREASKVLIVDPLLAHQRSAEKGR